MVRRLVAGLGAIMLVAGLALGIDGVIEREAVELETFSEPVPLEPTREAEGSRTPHRELMRVELREGEDVVFEVCSQRPLDDAWVDAFEIIVWHPEDQEVIVRAPLDARLMARARSSARGTCIVVARGSELPVAGEFAIEAVWEGRELPASARLTPLRAHVIAYRPLGATDRVPALVALLGAVILVLGACWGRRQHDPGRETGSSAAVRVAAGLFLFLAVVVGLAFLPLYGSTGGVVRGLGLAAMQILLAGLLIHAAVEGTDRAAALGLTDPKQQRWILVLAPVIGVGLWLLGMVPRQLVPATGEAPIETLVSFPSGTLAVGLVAVAVPVAEELFFRGFMFGMLSRRLGGAFAFVLTALIFAAAHAPQAWGAWGSLAAIAITGIVLTLLRWWTGSVFVPVLAHLAHNGAILVSAQLLA